MSKFVDNLVFLAVTVVVFTLEDDGRVWDCLARGVLIIDADNLVGYHLNPSSYAFRLLFVYSLGLGFF